MNRPEFPSDTEAASPVIGVILMLGVTIILSAVIGTAVLGTVAGLRSDAPVASFDFDYNRSDGSYDCSSYFRQDSFGEDGLYNYCESAGEFEVAPDTGGILTITHTGGETIPADQLYAFGASTHGTVAWSDSECLASGENCAPDSDIEYDETDTIAPGNEFEIWIRDGDDISVVWSSPGGGQSEVLAQYRSE